MEKYDSSKEELAKLYCLLYDDLTFFDLRPLLKENLPLEHANHFFTFCTRFKDEEGKHTFAYYKKASTGISSILGDGVEMVRLNDGGKATKTLAIQEEDHEKPRHIYFEVSGGEKCPFNESTTYKTRYEVFCNSNEGAP